MDKFKEYDWLETMLRLNMARQQLECITSMIIEDKNNPRTIDDQALYDVITVLNALENRAAIECHWSESWTNRRQKVEEVK